MIHPMARRSDDSLPIPMLQHIPLSSAYLCQDCNCIGNSAIRCPACASEVLMNLAAVLDRDVESIAEPSYSYAPSLVA